MEAQVLRAFGASVALVVMGTTVVSAEGDNHAGSGAIEIRIIGGNEFYGPEGWACSWTGGALAPQLLPHPFSLTVTCTPPAPHVCHNWQVYAHGVFLPDGDVTASAHCGGGVTAACRLDGVGTTAAINDVINAVVDGDVPDPPRTWCTARSPEAGWAAFAPAICQVDSNTLAIADEVVCAYS